MSKTVFLIALTAIASAATEVSAALANAGDKFIVTVTNHMPRHISLPEIGLFLRDVNHAEGGNAGKAVVTSKDALLRCVASIEAIAQLNGYSGECVTLEFDLVADESTDEDLGEEAPTDLDVDQEGGETGNTGDGENVTPAAEPAAPEVKPEAAKATAKNKK